MVMIDAIQMINGAQSFGQHYYIELGAAQRFKPVCPIDFIGSSSPD